MGRFWALAIFVVTLAVLYEVIARTAFGQATLWSNETTIYSRPSRISSAAAMRSPIAAMCAST